MPSIKEVRPGVFRVRVRVKDPATSKWGFSSKSIRGTEHDAQQLGRDMETAKDRGLLQAKRTPTVATFAGKEKRKGMEWPHAAVAIMGMATVIAIIALIAQSCFGGLW